MNVVDRHVVTVMLSTLNMGSMKAAGKGNRLSMRGSLRMRRVNWVKMN